MNAAWASTLFGLVCTRPSSISALASRFMASTSASDSLRMARLSWAARSHSPFNARATASRLRLRTSLALASDPVAV